MISSKAPTDSRRSPCLNCSTNSGGISIGAGVALMALGTLAENPDCGLKIVPCGMNYFHAHKFRSRAVIEFGTPIDIPPELVEQFKHISRNGERLTIRVS
jgi:1-acyl-sn-glycerol-3-phosphate acyltransferase